MSTSQLVEAWSDDRSSGSGQGRTPPGWVLVVDDDATDRMAAFRLLEREGHQATVADGAGAALELLRAEPYDLVLLDLTMPDPDGHAVLTLVKSDPGLSHIPVIVLAASGGDGAGRSLELGAADVLVKPFDPVLFRLRVNNALTVKYLREGQSRYRRAVDQVAGAAAAMGDAAFDPASLDHLARRPDSLGRLARLVQQWNADHRSVEG